MSTSTHDHPTTNVPRFVRIRGFAAYYGGSNFLFSLAGDQPEPGFTAEAVSQAAFVTTIGDQTVYFADMLVPFSTELMDAIVARRNLFISGGLEGGGMPGSGSTTMDSLPGGMPPKGPPYGQYGAIEYLE